ncbi:GNAT family N-acetyltransferase [Candidatus Parcubacteria bacterium]|nr:MAG: GNAT family N-acetyltransferase [Candidatus Parcubacteria bacterium]
MFVIFSCTKYFMLISVVYILLWTLMVNKKTLISIKTAKVSDADSIVKILRTTWMATYPNSSLGIDESNLKVYLRKVRPQAIRDSISHQSSNEFFWLVRVNRKPVGLCKVVKEEGEVRIKMLYILPKYQGIGAGSALMQKVLRTFGHRSNIVLNVARYNRRAIAFYIRFGFIRTRRKVQTSLDKLPGGIVIPEVAMVRQKKD